jgi:hypothetical protein
MKKEFVKIIPEFKLLSDEYKSLKRKAKKVFRKIKVLEEKYYFLDRIIEPRKKSDVKENDVELEFAIMHLFESLNFKCEKPKENANVDVKATYRNFYFGLEVKNGNYVEENDTLQAHKHKVLNSEFYHPIIVYNNATTNASWDAPRIKMANEIGYGLLLTPELLKAYNMLKSDKLTFEEFLFMLSLKGEIKFSRRFIDRAYKAKSLDEAQHKGIM